MKLWPKSVLCLASLGSEIMFLSIAFSITAKIYQGEDIRDIFADDVNDLVKKSSQSVIAEDVVEKMPSEELSLSPVDGDNDGNDDNLEKSILAC